MPQKVYIETTIPSFYYNRRTEPEMVACCHWTRQWWDHRRQLYEVVSSLAVVEELEEGAHPDRDRKLRLMEAIPLLPVTDEVAQIAEIYIARKVMPQDPAGDALHLALASYYKCDVLLTWNCRHLANFNKFEHIRRVNTLLGLPVPTLLTPFELLEGGEEDEAENQR